MMKTYELSRESKKFLEDLRVYLFSSGKNEEEIDSIIEELEVHLLEAEKQGKSIDKIIGQSPKEYMEQLSKEMDVDYLAWLKYIPIIIIGAFSFNIIDDMIKGELAYSLLEIFGHIFIVGIYMFTVFKVFKYISANNVSRMMKGIMFVIISTLPVGLFFGLIYLNRAVETPIIHFGLIGTIIIAIIAL